MSTKKRPEEQKIRREAVHPRPMRALLLHLSESTPSAYGKLRISQHARSSMRVIQLGLGAIGHLMAQSAGAMEEGAIPAECVESLGVLMAELSDLSSACYEIAVRDPDLAVSLGEPA